MNKTELERAIEVKKAEIIAKVKEMENFEIDPDGYEDDYCDAIDEGGEVKIGSLTYSASYVLREVDPTAYRCGLNDYVDGIDKEETKAYKELEEELENLNDELESLESDLEEMEDEDEDN